MKRANEITDELKEMGSILADLSRAMPYTVPAGYFAGFHNSLKSTITDINKEEATPAWGKAMPFSTPAGYFSELAGNITAAARVADMPQQAPFTVPAGYFDDMPSRILQAAKDADAPQKAKTIPLRRNVFRQLRWAAAAVLITGIGFGSYHFYDAQKADPENMLAAVPGSEIQDYVAGTYRIDPTRLVANTEISNIQLDNKDIIEYLDETGWD